MAACTRDVISFLWVFLRRSRAKLRASRPLALGSILPVVFRAGHVCRDNVSQVRVAEYRGRHSRSGRLRTLPRIAQAAQTKYTQSLKRVNWFGRGGTATMPRKPTGTIYSNTKSAWHLDKVPGTLTASNTKSVRHLDGPTALQVPSSASCQSHPTAIASPTYATPATMPRPSLPQATPTHRDPSVVASITHASSVVAPHAALDPATRTLDDAFGVA